jgi:colanic acid/amylovoran biosynthesis glycosyltransferase
MKRIVLIVPVFPKLSETFIINKFVGLLERGWDVHVVCGESTPGELHRFSKLQNLSGVARRIHNSWPHRPRWFAAFFLPLALLRGLRHAPRTSWRYLHLGYRRFGWQVLRHFYLDSEIIGLQPDLIHWEFGALAVNRLYLKELLNCKALVSFRGYDLNFVGLETPDYYKEVWDNADALHLLGNDLWRRALKRGCMAKKPHAIIPPAIDAEMFNSHERQHLETTGSADRPLRILSVGRMEWKKGYEYSLQAVKLLADQGLHCDYRIVGNGDYLGPIGFTRHQLGLESIVQLMGALSPLEVRNQMLWADVFLHAAVSEGFCNAVIEAQAMMLPVVCSDAGGLSENIAPGETGFVVPRRDPEAMAEKLGLLARDHGYRQKLGQAGRQRVLRHFQLVNQIEAFEVLYQQVMNNLESCIDESR